MNREQNNGWQELEGDMRNNYKGYRNKPGSNGSTSSLDCGSSYTKAICQSLPNSKLGTCVGAGGEDVFHWFYLIFFNFLHCSFRVISAL